MKKMLLGMLVAVAMIFAASCGGVDPPVHQAEPGVQQEAAGTAPTPAVGEVPQPGRGIDYINWDEHVTFTWFMISTPSNDFFTSYNDEPVANYLMYRFNVTFDFQQAVVGTEADALALMMGSGNFTDAIHLGPFAGNVPQLYEDGIIVDIAQWLDYMPNFRRLLEDPDVARRAMDDNGRILMLPSITDEPGYAFAGLVYRHDILETMTGGNVQFPSGNEMPTTIADWEYMLPLFLEFFQMAGFADFAPLILPAGGVFHFGPLMNSFGAYHEFFVRDGVVYAGIMQPEFFDYVYTMRRWFENGWIHQDFATRVGDMFFMPNPPLVFGGAAGAFYGMIMHLGDRLSMPDFGMYVEIRPMPSPMAEGITHRDMLRRRADEFGESPRHTAVSTSNPDIGRFLAVIDHMYSWEQAPMKAFGLRGDQIPPGFDILDRMGMPEGSQITDATGNPAPHPNLSIAGGTITDSSINGIRLPGVMAHSLSNAMRDAETVAAHAAWTAQDAVSEIRMLPLQLSPTVAETAILTSNDAHISDLRDQMLIRFIMGTEPLNEATWNEFLNQLRAFGIEESRDIWQAAYDRFLVRGQ